VAEFIKMAGNKGKVFIRSNEQYTEEEAEAVLKIINKAVRK